MTNYRQTMANTLEFMHIMNEFRILERDLSDSEKKRREEIAQDMNDGDFKSRYGDRWKEVKMAVATKQAKKESIEEAKAEVRQLKDPKKEMMIKSKDSGVFVIDKKDFKKYERKGFFAVEEVQLTEDNMDLMRKAAKGAMQTIKFKDGKQKMDSFTASGILAVYDKVNPKNKKKLETIINKGTVAQVLKLQSLAMKASGRKEELELDEKVHYSAPTKDGKNTFQVIDRDTKGMRGKQDEYKMVVVDKKGKVVKDWGSHISVDGAVMMAKNRKIIEEVELDERITRDQTYFKSYSDAVAHALKYTKDRGYEVDEDDFHMKVTTGPRKPNEGQTVSQRIDVTKNGKPQRKQLSFQVYNKGGRNPYELNVYVEEVELDEHKGTKPHKHPHEDELDEANFEIKNGKLHISKADYAKKSKDYKGKRNGKPTLTALDPKTGATTNFEVVLEELDEGPNKATQPVIVMRNKNNKNLSVSVLPNAKDIKAQEKKGMRIAYALVPYPSGSSSKEVKDPKEIMKLIKGGDKLNIGEKFTRKDFDKNEDENKHTENAVELINLFGNNYEKRQVAQIKKDHDKLGHIVQQDQKVRDAMVKKYLSKLKEEIELEEGRMKELHGYIEDGKPAEWIAKKMKLDVKTVKALMDEKGPLATVDESARSDAMKAMRGDPILGKRDDKEDDDSASAADIKAASKNIMFQLQNVIRLKGSAGELKLTPAKKKEIEKLGSQYAKRAGGGYVEFSSGKKEKVDPKVAVAVWRKFQSIRRPIDKQVFQAKIARSYKDMLSALKESIMQEGTWHLPVGPQGRAGLRKLLKKPVKAKDAVDSIDAYIGDDELFDDFADLEKDDPNQDVRPTIKAAMKRLGIKEDTILDRIAIKIQERKNG